MESLPNSQSENPVDVLADQIEAWQSELDEIKAKIKTGAGDIPALSILGAELEAKINEGTTELGRLTMGRK